METKNKQKDIKIIKKVEVIIKTGQRHNCKKAKNFEMEVDRKRQNRHKKREETRKEIYTEEKTERRKGEKWKVECPQFSN